MTDDEAAAVNALLSALETVREAHERAMKLNPVIDAPVGGPETTEHYTRGWHGGRTRYAHVRILAATVVGIVKAMDAVENALLFRKDPSRLIARVKGADHRQPGDVIPVTFPEDEDAWEACVILGRVLEEAPFGTVPAERILYVIAFVAKDGYACRLVPADAIWQGEGAARAVTNERRAALEALANACRVLGATMPPIEPEPKDPSSSAP